MFKKIEIWILYLVVLLGIPVTIGFGSVVRHEIIGGTKLGRISETALFFAEIPANIKKIFFSKNPNEVLDRFPLLDSFNGTPNASESYLLLSRYDGDLKEGIVELVDLTNFKILHTWNPDINSFNKLISKIDEFKYMERDQNNSRQLLTHPKLIRDGGLIINTKMLRKINACSNLIFQKNNDILHHSIETDIEGNIWVPSTIYPQILKEKVGNELNADGGYADDGIVKLSPDGEILFEKSVSQIFIDNGLEYLLFSVGDRNFKLDPIHLNDIQPVNDNGEFWQKGDVFLSLRHQSMVFLYRPLTNEIIWKGTGPFFHQHDVDILDDHRISIFDNNAKILEGGRTVDGYNRVIIYDFNKDEFSSYLTESLEENDVRTPNQGRSQILINNDLIVEESFYARLLYFNNNGSLRWSHVNRAKNGNVYKVGWSRILYTQEDIKNVENFMNNKITCDE